MDTKKPENIIYDVSAEGCVLGSMGLSPKNIDKALDILEADDFGLPEHGIIFDAFKDLYLESEQKKILGGELPAVDLVILRNKLQSQGKLEDIGGICYLTKIYDTVPTSANLLYYCDIVKDFSKRRKLLKSTQTISKMFDDFVPTADIQAKFQEEALSFDDVSSGQRVNLADCLQDAKDDLLGRGKNDSVETGFFDLDCCLRGGFRPGQLIIIGARPGVGKTAIALNMATHQASLGKHICFVSLEMPAKEIVKRVILSQARVSQNKLLGIKSTASDIAALDAAALMLQKFNFTILDYASLEPTQLRAKIKVLNAQKQIDCLYVDYCQLMTAKADNIRERINEVTRQLKLISKDEHIPVVLMSQLNRLSDGRTDNMPRLSDLKESGSLEQDADIVMLLNRVKAFNPESEDNSTELIVAKHRNGRQGIIELVYFGEYFKFENKADNILI